MKSKTAHLRSVCVITLLLLAGGIAKSAETNTLLVKVGEKQDTFAISEIKEVTFSDEHMTVVNADNTQITFIGDWEITFGASENTGVSEITFSSSDSRIEIFDLRGIKIMEASRLSEVNLKTLPQGTYIIKCGCKTLKIQI